MSHLRSERETADVASHTIKDKRSGKDRREQADRRCEPRFGDVVERRECQDRRRAIGNMSMD